MSDQRQRAPANDDASPDDNDDSGSITSNDNTIGVDVPSLCNPFSLLQMEDDDTSSDDEKDQQDNNDHNHAEQTAEEVDDKQRNYKKKQRRQKGRVDERLLLADELAQALEKSKGRITEKVYRLLQEVNRNIILQILRTASGNDDINSSSHSPPSSEGDIGACSKSDDKKPSATTEDVAEFECSVGVDDSEDEHSVSSKEKVREQLALPPMKSFLRQVFTKLAEDHYHLRAHTRGDRKQRCLVLYRTSRSAALAASVSKRIGNPDSEWDAFAEHALQTTLHTFGVDVNKLAQDWLISRQRGKPVGFDAKPLDSGNVGYRMFQQMGWAADRVDARSSQCSTGTANTEGRAKSREPVVVIVKDDRKGF